MAPTQTSSAGDGLPALADRRRWFALDFSQFCHAPRSRGLEIRERTRVKALRNEAKVITRDHTVKASLEEAERVRKMGGVVTGDRAEGILVTRERWGILKAEGLAEQKRKRRTVRFEGIRGEVG